MPQRRKVALIEECYGHQYKNDNAFTKQARLLQSMYRKDVLQEDYGVGPNETSPNRYGNMLKNGKKSGSNFLRPDIFRYAQQKAAMTQHIPKLTVEPFRLYNNMLSSMPLCFNLFYPLKEALQHDKAFIHQVIRAIFSDLPIHKVIAIHIEYVPCPSEDYTNDRTAFDAMIEFEDHDGNKGIIGIETKYTEPLGENNAKWNTQKITVAQHSGIFTPQTIQALQQKDCEQLLRNVLLTESYRMKQNYRYSKSIVLGPKERTDIRDKVETFKELLLPAYQNKIGVLTLRDFVRTAQDFGDHAHKAYLKEFHNRYLDFEKVNRFLEQLANPS